VFELKPRWSGAATTGIGGSRAGARWSGTSTRTATPARSCPPRTEANASHPRGGSYRWSTSRATWSPVLRALPPRRSRSRPSAVRRRTSSTGPPRGHPARTRRCCPNSCWCAACPAAGVRLVQRGL